MISLWAFVFIVISILFFAKKLASYAKSGDSGKIFIGSFVFLAGVALFGVLAGSEDYRDLTLLEKGRAFEILAVTECPDNNVCFILGSEIAGTKYYKTDKKMIEEAVESGDVVYTEDGKLKLYTRP